MKTGRTHRWLAPSLTALTLLAPFLVTGCSKKPPPIPAELPSEPAPPPKAHLPLTRLSHQDSATVVLAKLGERTVAYIADEDDASVRAIDMSTSELLGRTPLEGRPGQMIVDKAGRLLVALRTDQSVAVLESTADPKEPLDLTSKITTGGAEPFAMAITPDESTLVVTTAWGHSIEGYALATLERRFAEDVAREPRAVTIAEDGKTAYVAHAAASHMSVIALPSANESDKGAVAVRAAASKIDLGMPGWTERRSRFAEDFGSPLLLFKVDGESLGVDAAPGDPLVGPGESEPHHFICGTGRMMRTITFPSRVARQGFALAKVRVPVAPSAKAKKQEGDKTGSATTGAPKETEELFEERILIPHMAVATGDATVRSSGYGGGGLEEAESIPTELFDVDVVDAATSKRTTAFAARFGPARNGADACRLPRAAVVDAKHQRLFVSCLGVDKIMEYDATAKAPVAAFKRSIPVASGPTGIAIDESSEKAVVWSAFDRVVNVFSIAAPSEAASGNANAKAHLFGKAAPKAAPPAPPDVTKISLPAPSSPLSTEAALGEKLFHKAANTKVSRDGRACASCHPDGRDDGLVWSTPDGPRQTISLAGRVGREAPFGWLGKHGSLKEHITITMKNLKGTGASDEELNAIVAWLRAMPAPPRAKNVALGAKELRGKELFNSSALQCGSCHAEKTDFSDREAHDVASATGADVSRQFLVPSLRFVGGSSPYFHDGRYATLGELLEKNEKMGDTKSLSPDDRDALEAYLRTL